MAPFDRPSISDRTQSSPQGLYLHHSILKNEQVTVPSTRMMVLTPPASPLSPRHSRSSTDLSGCAGNSLVRTSDLTTKLCAGLGIIPPRQETPSLCYTPDGTLLCPYMVDLLKDGQNRNQVFGHGAWSTVLKATCRQASIQTSGLATPPQSPRQSPPILVAVKRPARKDAIPILNNEAKILTHLMTEQRHELHVVEFFGVIPSDSSLVLAAIPRSLEEYIKQLSTHCESTRTTSNMAQPVIGTERVWLDLAEKLVSALDWLHNEAMVVHGDIKPGNILLSSQTDEEEESLFPFQPLFADFSSAQLLNQEPKPNTLSAVTREYTAPELLTSKVLLDPASTATTGSDVFSLAVTLLVAATGNTMVYSGSMYQRQAMAVQGWGVINNVRNSSDDGFRVPRQGIVQRCVERAVLRADMGRINAESWRKLIIDTKREELGKLSKSALK